MRHRPARRIEVWGAQAMPAVKPTQQSVVGRWRITSMEMWDADYFDMEVPAYVQIRPNLHGEFQFGLVTGGFVAQFRAAGAVERVDFVWEGGDENDAASGHGWMEVQGDEAHGRICMHQGDDSDFMAVRQPNRDLK